MTNLVAGLVAGMKHLAQRQNVVARNIANADTAGYKARELEKPDFATALGKAGSAGIAKPRVTISPAMQAIGARGPILAGSMILDQNVSETKPDGNNVTLEDQVMKLGTIQADFTALTGLYKKQMQLMRIATRGN